MKVRLLPFTSLFFVFPSCSKEEASSIIVRPADSERPRSEYVDVPTPEPAERTSLPAEQPELSERSAPTPLDEGRDRNRRPEDRESRIAEMTARLTTRLTEMDADKDGKLAKNEVQGPLERRFDENDTNGDGYLDADEQKAMMEALGERMANGPGRRGPGGRGFRPGGGGRGPGGGRRERD